jgi:hypothetical protein
MTQWMLGLTVRNLKSRGCARCDGAVAVGYGTGQLEVNVVRAAKGSSPSETDTFHRGYNFLTGLRGRVS